MSAPALQPADTKTRFGTHQQFFVTACDVDRTSLAHIQIEMQVSDEGLNNFTTEFLSLGYGYGVAGECGVTSLLDVPEEDPTAIVTGVNRRYDREQSMGIYTYTYEGLLQNRSLYVQYELEFSMNQEPIETHPNFEVFEPIFGPYDAINRTWQRVPTARQAQAGGLPGGGTNASQVVTNPMFGVTSFLSPGAVFRLQYTDLTLDAEVLQGVGTKDEPPNLDQFKDFAEWVDKSRRDWLKLAPRVVKRGGAYQITMEWLLSGPRGWAEELYSDEAISHNAGSSGEPVQAGPGGGPQPGFRNVGPIENVF